MATTPVFESYSADFTSRIETAQRADGVWFSRYQYRDQRYGYKWSPWRRSGAPTFTDGTPKPIEHGQQKNVRLPK